MDERSWVSIIGVSLIIVATLWLVSPGFRVAARIAARVAAGGVVGLVIIAEAMHIPLLDYLL